MKYRMLTAEELAPLENDLKAFLIINGLDGDAWAALNQTDPSKARAVVGSFSDAVLHTVYERLSFLEHRSENGVVVFHIGDNNIQLVSFTRKAEHTELDLTTSEGIHWALKNHWQDFDWFTSKRALRQEREMEIHQLIENGCIPSSEEFWNMLAQLLEK